MSPRGNAARGVPLGTIAWKMLPVPRSLLLLAPVLLFCVDAQSAEASTGRGTRRRTLQSLRRKDNTNPKP